MSVRSTMQHVVIAAVLCAAPAHAQATLATLDAEYFAGRPAEALSGYSELLAHDSTNYDALWHASRAALALGMLGERQDMDTPMYLRAEALARAAVRQHPDRVEGHYWLAAALGRRALHAPIRPTVSLATATADEANRALAIDSLHAGAHDVLGKLNSEVCKLPRAVRFIAGKLLGVSVASATSWALAEQHLRRAVELDSTMIIYRVDLAEMYMRTDRKTEAGRVLREVLAMPRVHPIDERLQRDALSMSVSLPH